MDKTKDKAHNPKELHQLKNKQIQKSVYESKLNAIILRTVKPTDDRFVESVKKLYPLEAPQILNTNILSLCIALGRRLAM